MTEDRERIVRLEAKFEVIENFMRDSAADRKLLHQALEKLTSQMERQRSFVGGVVFVVSALWAFALAIKGWILDHAR
jgi:hypothetical protein